VEVTLPSFEISHERLKLETSNLACGRMAVSSDEKMQYCVIRGHVGSREVLL